MKKSRFEAARKALIFWTLFIGIGAVAGAFGMLFDPSGKAMHMDAMLPYFKKLPFADVLFSDLKFSGYALLIANGITNLTAAVFLFKRKKAGVILGGIFGVTLMLWICIQFYMFPLNFMSTIYFIFGLAQAITGYAAFVFMKQEEFSVSQGDYPNIGSDKKLLVVYFSRMGYTKKLALEEANRTGACVFEIRSTEKTDGTKGFWKCGRYAMHRWDMPIEKIPDDISKYDNVTICTPIWVFSLASVTRAFCRSVKGKVKGVNYIIVHHTNGRYENAADEMDTLLGLRRAGIRSVRCRKGVFRELL